MKEMKGLALRSVKSRVRGGGPRGGGGRSGRRRHPEAGCCSLDLFCSYDCRRKR